MRFGERQVARFEIGGRGETGCLVSELLLPVVSNLGPDKFIVSLLLKRILEDRDRMWELELDAQIMDLLEPRRGRWFCRCQNVMSMFVKNIFR